MSQADPNRLQVPRKFAGKRFDRVLAELIPDHTQAQLQKLVRKGRVRVDGKKVVRSNFALRGGELIELREESGGAPPVALELNYLHTDDDFAVVDKPAGLLTHPVDRSDEDSVSKRLVERFGPLPTFDTEPRPGIVHRLDRWTSGVMVVARTERAMETLRDQFRERTVEKCYLAVVRGIPKEESFKLEQALGPEPGPRKRMRIDRTGQAARTSFTLLEQREETALLECRPETGRRHQIRVHLAAIGLPVVGDVLYGEKDATVRANRHLLHAVELAFDHPRTGERLSFRAEPPVDLQR